MCVLTLVLFTLPDLVSRKLNLKLPNTLEAVVYIFIFSAEILGEIQNFYGVFPHWDTLLHTINGFICAAVGFSLADLLNENADDIEMTPAFLALVAFCFSMTIGIFWEFIEFSIDHYLAMDMQKDQIVYAISSVELNKKMSNKPIRIDNINKTIIYNDSGITIVDGYLDIGIYDTMKDLFVNFVGALVFSMIGYVYIKNRDKHPFAEMFIPKVIKKVL